MTSVVLRGLVLGSIPLLAACQTVGADRPSGSSAPSTITIATWNLEHLAQANGTGCRPRADPDYQELRDHVIRLNADVIALQEVENEQAAARIFPADQWIVVMSKRPETARSGTCREAPSQAIRRQAVGFAIRRGIPFTRNNDVSDLGLGDPDLRWGVDVTLNLPTPIRLLGVHLKSGCNAGRDPSDKDCEISFRQAPIVEDWIDARARSDEHYAVLGDWNRRTGLANDAFLAMISDDDPSAGRIIMTNAGRRATCIARYADYIDHIAIGVAAQTRLVPGSFREYRYGNDEKRFPSDHCPQAVTIQAR